LGVSAIGLDIVFPFGKMSTESDQGHAEPGARHPQASAEQPNRNIYEL
jgi:hypothetical protein